MKLLKFLTTSIITLLTFSTGITMKSTSKEILTPTIDIPKEVVSFSTNFQPLQIYPDLSPSFALQIIKEGLDIIINTFNDPQNSFNIIINPEQRKVFLEQTLQSIDSLTQSLSQITNSISLPSDLSQLNSINDEIDSLINEIVDDIENFILTSENNFYIFDSDLRSIFSQRFNQSILTQNLNQLLINNNITIFLPYITERLNETEFDLSTIYSKINSYPLFPVTNEDITSISPIFQFKISDIFGNIISNFNINSPIIINLPYKCDNCKIICAIFDNKLGEWKSLTSNSMNGFVNCSIDSKQQSSYLTQNPDNSFYTITLFTQKSENSDDNSKTNLILAITIPVGIVTIISLVYLIKKYREKKFKNLKQDFVNYGSV